MAEESQQWQQCEVKVFWGEIAPSEHVVQIYENEQVFLDLLEGYVSGGLKAGDSVILILTEEHRKALYDRLYAENISLHYMITRGQFIVLDAEKTLSEFMINGWPDEALFMKVVSGLVGHARQNGKSVRAFGEMVALLWAKGHNGATVRLEHLWNKFCEKENFTLFCAYPRSGFTADSAESMLDICCKHTKMVASFNGSKTNLQYVTSPLKKAV